MVKIGEDHIVEYRIRDERLFINCSVIDLEAWIIQSLENCASIIHFSTPLWDITGVHYHLNQSWYSAGSFCDYHN